MAEVLRSRACSSGASVIASLASRAVGGSGCGPPSTRDRGGSGCGFSATRPPGGSGCGLSATRSNRNSDPASDAGSGPGRGSRNGPGSGGHGSGHGRGGWRSRSRRSSRSRTTSRSGSRAMIHGMRSTSQMWTRASHTARLSADRTTRPRTQQLQKGQWSMTMPGMVMSTTTPSCRCSTGSYAPRRCSAAAVSGRDASMAGAMNNRWRPRPPAGVVSVTLPSFASALSASSPRSSKR